MVISLLAQTGTAAAQAIACRPPLKPMLRTELFFGHKTGTKSIVSERQWTRFVERELSPRFPDGLTVIDGRGRWRDPRGNTTIREPTKIVVVVAEDNAATRDQIDAVAVAYKRRFRQQSVGIAMAPVCAAF